MITIAKRDTQLLLVYQAEFGPSRWVDDQLDRHRKVTIRRVFTFTPASLVAKSQLDEEYAPDGDEETECTFVLGQLEGEYYRIDRDILKINHDVWLFKDMPISDKTFIAERGISIFNNIDRLVSERIVVGGDAAGAVPVSDFNQLLMNFPTSTELRHYAQARISGVLRDHFRTMSDAQKKLDDYLNRRKRIRTPSRVEFLGDYERLKFKYVRDELRRMLREADGYSEKDWQKLIVGFLLLLFPRYIAVLENLQVKDLSSAGKPKDRYIDLALVDANGTLDIVEIKKPFANCLLSTHRYRDNYIPKSELSGSVMQAEKYLFYLTKWGIEGERRILKKRKDELPEGLQVRITNPKALLILGRDCDFSGDQMFDFEIMKRKYANVIDILTYDDLLRRLDNIITMVRKNYAPGEQAEGEE